MSAPSPQSLSQANSAAAFRTQLFAVMFASVASMTGARACDAMLPELAREFQGSLSSVSQVVAAFTLGYGVVQLFFGPIGDRYGKLRVITLAALGASLASAVCALATDVKTLTAARFFAGTMSAGVVPLAIAWIGDSVPYERRQAEMAKLLVGTLTGMMAGQSLGGIATDTVGWRSAFWIVAAMFAVSVFRLTPHARAKPAWVNADPNQAIESSTNLISAALKSYRDVLIAPNAKTVYPVILAEGVLVFGITAFLPSFLHIQDGVSLTIASLVVACFGLGGMFYAWRSQVWLAKLGEHGFARTGASIFAVGMIIAIWMPSLLAAIVGCFAAGIGFYMLHNTMQTLGSQLQPKARGAAMSLFAFTFFIGQTMGISISAYLGERFGFPAVFVTSSLAIAAVGWWLAARLQRAKQ